MGSYLKEKKPRGAVQGQQHGTREGSMGSRSSIGSDHQDNMPSSETFGLLNGHGTRESSKTVSFDGSPHSQRRLTPEAQASRLARTPMDFILPSAPMVLPPRTGVTLVYDKLEPAPFESIARKEDFEQQPHQSIGRPVDPFRSMFQASHSKVSVEDLKFHCSRSFGTKAMGMHWIPTLVQSPVAFLSTLCIASAHLDAIHEQPTESLATLALRQEVIYMINQNMVNPQKQTDDYNIISVMQVIASEIITGDGGPSLNVQEFGIESLINLRGGLDKLGVNGRLASSISWIALESAILRERKPLPMYLDYSASVCTKNYPNTATVPESPLYCPRGDFETIKRSTNRSPQAMDLLKEIRTMMDFFLHETKQSRHNSSSLRNIHKRITQYPSIAALPQTSTVTFNDWRYNDWRYEAIRIAACLTATAIMQREPLSSSLKHLADAENGATTAHTPSTIASDNAFTSPTSLRHDSPLTHLAPTHSNPFDPFNARRRHSSTRITPTDKLLTRLKHVLENSNLSDCWADMAGVLLWVALTVGAAGRQAENKAVKKWFKALAMRVSIVLCFEHPEAMHASLLRMGDLVEGVGGNGNRGPGRDARVKRNRTHR